MKRIGALLGAVLIIAMLLASTACFAGTGDLTVEKTYPKEGQSNLQSINCGVKIWFNEPIAENEANKACFTLKDAEGVEQPTQVLWSEKEPNLVLVLAKENLVDNSGYSLDVSDALTAENGDTLSEGWTLSFATRNPKTDSMISMGLMGVMMAAIIVMSMRTAKGEAKKKQEQSGKEEKVNPYKVSKETGKSVEQIVEKTNKEKAKKAVAEAKKAAAKSKADAQRRLEEEKAAAKAAFDTGSGNRRVKGPRPISAGGSTYVTGRKALAEAAEKAAEEARRRGTTNPKNKGGKKKKK